jgi:hypothetical protein
LDSVRKFDLGKWLIYLTFAIAFLVFLDAPILALDWRNKPFPGFVVEQTLVVSDVEGEGWIAKKVGLDHPQLITRFAGKVVRSAEDFRTTMSDLSIGQNIEITTLSLDGVERVFPSILLVSFNI